MTRTQKKASALKPNVYKLKRKGIYEVSTNQSLITVRRSQTLEEAGCCLLLHGLQIKLKGLLRMNISGSSRNVVFKTAVEEMLRKHLSTVEVLKFADVIRT